MSLSLAELLAQHWCAYARAHRATLSTAHYRAVRRVLACRTPELGGRLYRCGDCHTPHFAYHSCNHRSCPQCGSIDQQQWSAKQEARLLPAPYFLVTFTLPAELRSLCLAHPKDLYDLLLRESAAALRDVIATKHHGGEVGLTSVFHSWGRQLQHHPHVHCIVPGLVYDPKNDRVTRPDNDTFLVHYRPVAERFRSRVQSALEKHHPDLYAGLTPEARRSLSPRQNWNVQIQAAGSGKSAVRYLARYVQRSALGPKRLTGYDNQGRVRLHWTSSQTGKSAVMTLHPHELIRRWLIHVLPKGFTRVRHYGFQSSAAKRTRLRVRLLLGAGFEPDVIPVAPEPFRCPSCGGALKFLCEIPRATSPRGPPPPSRA